MSKTSLNRGVVLGALIALGGFVALAIGFVWMRADIERRDWPTASGTLRSARLAKIGRARLYVEARRSDPLSEPVYQHDTVWTVEVDYEFMVDGKHFAGDRATSSRRVERADVDPPSVAMRELASSFKPGAVVTVHYRHNDPEQNYLVYFENPQVRKAQLIGGLLVAAGFAMVGVMRVWRG